MTNNVISIIDNLVLLLFMTILFILRTLVKAEIINDVAIICDWTFLVQYFSNLTFIQCFREIIVNFFFLFVQKKKTKNIKIK